MIFAVTHKKTVVLGMTISNSSARLPKEFGCYWTQATSYFGANPMLGGIGAMLGCGSGGGTMLGCGSGAGAMLVNSGVAVIRR